MQLFISVVISFVLFGHCRAQIATASVTVVSQVLMVTTVSILPLLFLPTAILIKAFNGRVREGARRRWGGEEEAAEEA